MKKSDFRTDTHSRSGFMVMFRLIGLVKPLAGFMMLAVVMGFLGHLCATFITVLGGYAVLEALHIYDILSLRCLFGLIALCAVMRGILRYAEQACNHFIAFKLLALIRDKVFGALRRLCPAKLEVRDKGDLISVITSDIELLEVFYAHTVSPAAIAFLFTGVMSFIIWSYHWILGLLALASYITVGIAIPMATSKLSGDIGLTFRNKSGELSAFVLDSLRGLAEILQYDQGENRLNEMKSRMGQLENDEEKIKYIAGRNGAVTNVTVLIFDAAMLFLSAGLFQMGSIEFDGMLISALTLFSSFGPVIALANLGSTLQNTFAAGNRVLDILDDTPVVSEVVGKPKVEFLDAEAANVTFSYDENEAPVLSDVSVYFPPNSIVGLIGKSGSGKSTLLKLFMRFWDIQQGSIKISGNEVNDINTDNLRDMESFVTQDTHLFHDSIKNNIRIAKLTATEEEIMDACRKASIHDFIMTLPEGYDTPAGELGESLSGGERQRIGLARAFLHGAKFILLDEPTSNLDSLNEAVILKSLDKERDGKTVVLVSHRQSTMKIADKVYSVEHGRMS